MNTSRRLTAALAATGVAIAAALSVASPAQAAPPDNCPHVSMCGYVNSGFETNQGYEVNPARTNGTCEEVSFNDAWSSIWNGSGKVVRFFRDTGCHGSSFALPNGEGSMYLSLSHPTLENRITSFRWGG